jgi:MFS family permease
LTYEIPNASTVHEGSKKMVDAEFRVFRNGHQQSQPPDSFGDGACTAPAISNLRYKLSHIVLAFMLAYTFMNGVSGRLLDRLGTRIAYGLTIAFWSGAEILHALSAGALSLGIFQFLLGVGEAGIHRAGVKLITEWFPPEKRSHASGIFNSGESIGTILVPPLLALIILANGRRTAFVVIGLLRFIWLAVWPVIYREPGATSTKDQANRLPLRMLLRSRFFGCSPCQRSLAIRSGTFTSSGSRNILKWPTHFRCRRSAKQPGYRSLRPLLEILLEVLCSLGCCAQQPGRYLHGGLQSLSFQC